MVRLGPQVILIFMVVLVGGFGIAFHLTLYTLNFLNSEKSTKSNESEIESLIQTLQPMKFCCCVTHTSYFKRPIASLSLSQG